MIAQSWGEYPYFIDASIISLRTHSGMKYVR